jgi:hypothetical protein
MPRSTREIIDQADALAHRFEEHVSDLSNARSADTLRHVRQAFLDRARAEKELLVAVQSARSDNQSWGDARHFGGGGPPAIRTHDRYE